MTQNDPRRMPAAEYDRRSVFRDTFLGQLSAPDAREALYRLAEGMLAAFAELRDVVAEKIVSEQCTPALLLAVGRDIEYLSEHLARIATCDQVPTRPPRPRQTARPLSSQALRLARQLRTLADEILSAVEASQPLLPATTSPVSAEKQQGEG